MDIEILAYNMFRNEQHKGKKDLKARLQKQFKSITDKQMNEVTLRIFNYQLDKYGQILYEDTYDYYTSTELVKKNHRASGRKCDKRRYYEKQGRR